MSRQKLQKQESLLIASLIQKQEKLKMQLILNIFQPPKKLALLQYTLLFKDFIQDKSSRKKWQILQLIWFSFFQEVGQLKIFLGNTFISEKKTFCKEALLNQFASSLSFNFTKLFYIFPGQKITTTYPFKLLHVSTNYLKLKRYKKFTMQFLAKCTNNEKKNTYFIINAIIKQDCQITFKLCLLPTKLFKVCVSLLKNQNTIIKSERKEEKKSHKSDIPLLTAPSTIEYKSQLSEQIDVSFEICCVIS
eukprot:TRINITY_DN12110_c0_g1_i11.p1 TRINITY_DN12110_c0_g1~~TRINITY_DN12110_c0_g1_i11.p1  ORF type:complete len:248 (+),score=-2.07 TRINITY_DN12110_c0_g1_i11:796-1539(+)